VLRMKNVVRFENVSKNILEKGNIIPILDNVTLYINEGEFIVFYGPSGSGKTTILNIISGFEKPSNGRVVVFDVDIGEARWRDLVRLRREKLSYGMQANLVIPRTSVEVNIALPLIIRGLEYDVALEKARVMAGRLGISHTLGRPAYTLSGGELRRLVVARALVVEVPLLVLDEPTSSLDSDTARLVWRVVEEVKDELNSTVVVASHDKYAVSYASRTVRLEKGRIISIN